LTYDKGLAAKLRGYGPIGLAAIAIIVLATIYIELLPPVLVLLWAWAAKVPREEIGFAKPRSWAVTITGGLVVGVLLKLILKALLLPLLGAPTINPAFHYIVGNPAALAKMVVAVILLAGFGEEIVYRGYLFERLRRILGNGTGATAAIVAITTAIFALAHLATQGVPSAENAAFGGLAFALMYVFTGSLWLSIIAHASFDLAAIVIIYFDVENAVARSVWG
jgi:membrane protease YdiL (CAAX protease family)